MTHEKSWPAISAALLENFVRSKYANSVSQFLLQFLSFCSSYKDFVRQLKAFLPSFCHLRACEMSPGWRHLITLLDPLVWGIWTAFSTGQGGIWTVIFKIVKCPGGCLGGGDVEASIWPIHYILQRKRSVGYLRKTLWYWNFRRREFSSSNSLSVLSCLENKNQKIKIIIFLCAWLRLCHVCELSFLCDLKADTHKGFCSRSMLQGHAHGAKLLRVYQWFHGYTSCSGAEFSPAKCSTIFNRLIIWEKDPGENWANLKTLPRVYWPVQNEPGACSGNKTPRVYGLNKLLNNFISCLLQSSVHTVFRLFVSLFSLSMAFTN